MKEISNQNPRTAGLLILALAAVLIAGAAPALQAENFYSGLSEEARQELALSYLMVSRQYAAVDKTDKAAAHEEMALQIYPGVKKYEAALQDSGLDSETPETETAPEETGDSKKEIQTRRQERPDYAIKYTFNAFLRAFFQENPERLYRLLADPDMTVEEFYSFTSEEPTSIPELFSRHDYTSVPFSRIFDNSSIRIREASAPASREDAYGVWAMDIQVSSQAPGVMDEMMPRWGKKQTYYFVHQEGRWKIQSAEFR